MSDKISKGTSNNNAEGARDSLLEAQRVSAIPAQPAKSTMSKSVIIAVGAAALGAVAAFFIVSGKGDKKIAEPALVGSAPSVSGEGSTLQGVPTVRAEVATAKVGTEEASKLTYKSADNTSGKEAGASASGKALGAVKAHNEAKQHSEVHAIAAKSKGTAELVLAPETSKAANTKTAEAAPVEKKSAKDDAADHKVMASSVLKAETKAGRSGADAEKVASLIEAAAVGGEDAPVSAIQKKKAVEVKELPEAPSKSSQRRAMGKKLPALRKCAGGKAGTATAKLRLRNDGSVGAVSILGPYKGAEAACMKKALQSATFPAFKRPFYDITYPFSIR